MNEPRNNGAASKCPRMVSLAAGGAGGVLGRVASRVLAAMARRARHMIRSADDGRNGDSADDRGFQAPLPANRMQAGSNATAGVALE